MKNKITYALVSLLMLFSITICFAQQDGSVDMTFNPDDLGWSNRLSGRVNEIIEQSDGKVIIVGLFSQYLGNTVHNIIRLNNDETFDGTFNSGTGTNGVVNNILRLPDGKLFIVGAFTSYNGFACNGIARLNEDGSFDDTFNATNLVSNRGVLNPVLLPDGKILLVYYIDYYRHKLVRLNTDGIVDINFDIDSVNNTLISGIAVQSDGKVLVAGLFYLESFNNSAAAVIRYNSDGSQDTSLVVNLSQYLNNPYLVLQEDGKFVVCYTGENGSIISRYNVDGSQDDTFQIPDDLQNVYFTDLRSYNSGKLYIQIGAKLKRLNSDGSHDVDFNVPNTGELTCAIRGVSQSGKIYVNGNYVKLNGVLDNGLARLNIDGSSDDTFYTGAGAVTGADGGVGALVQDDNKIIISGTFQSYNGVLRNNIARLNEDGTLDPGFAPDQNIEDLGKVVSLYPGGKVLVEYDGRIKRLNSDGSIDATFTAQQFSHDSRPELSRISAVVVLPDGKIIVGGPFNRYGNISIGGVVRLNANGSVDNDFDSSLFGNDNPQVYLLHLPQEQRVLVGTTGASSILYKIDYNGNEDATFNHVPRATMFWLDSFAVEADGKIIVAGYGDGQSGYRQRLVRFNANGTLNTILVDVDYYTSSTFVYQILTAPDGKFYQLSTTYLQPTQNVSFARFNNDGTIDNTFISGSGFGNIAFQGNSIIFSGSFSSYNGVGKNNIIRLNTSGLMSSPKQTAKAQTVFAYKNNDALQVESVGQAIKEVKVYDMAGRLLSDTKNVNALSTTVTDVLHSRILIVNVKLEDDTVVSKKIYY
ncbi:hypothetical protein GR160_11270 [Flavobacterium sp. Sd200]|uniref:delta-60 repeat domain-containing protein n=1 Tax=Flavobacterium sp. Sd200 TaxID=2692211 RepID=UPI001368506D|nr:delta-60 repeat domain-containing protein [Flavobacterium sp. Sd200]MXN91806.1 hypothetical protein [Flavobacterium sp. Sd200]